MIESFIALRHVRTRKRQSALSVIAIALAVAISSTSISLQTGFQNMLFDIIIEDLPHVTVSPKEGDDYIHLYKNLMDKIWSIKGVAVVSPMLAASATLTYKDNVENVALIGIVPQDAGKVYTSVADNIVRGDWYSLQSGNRIVLGQKMAERLKVRLGDSVVASFPDATPEVLLVSGIYNPPTGFPEEMTFVSLSTAKGFLRKGDVVNSVDVKLSDVYQADAVSREISNLGYNAKSWQQLYPEILRTIAIENFQNRLIMLLIMIIASFGVTSVMYLLVNEKVREIGMLMAMGADSTNIRNVFLYESGLLGAAGGILGAIAGLAMSLYLKSLQITAEAPGGQQITLPVVIDPWDYAIIVLLAVALSIVAGAYPARKASRLDPVEALKG